MGELYAYAWLKRDTTSVAPSILIDFALVDTPNLLVFFGFFVGQFVPTHKASVFIVIVFRCGKEIYSLAKLKCDVSLLCQMFLNSLFNVVIKVVITFRRCVLCIAGLHRRLLSGLHGVGVVIYFSIVFLLRLKLEFCC